MDYEKLYKDALERAKKALKTCGSLDCEAARLILKLFSQLCESDDERIRRELINLIEKSGHHPADKARWIAWLEKQKEQHPSSKFRSGDWVVYDGPLGHAILQVKDVVDGRYTFVDNDSTLLEEDSDKFLRPLTPKDVEKPAEWNDTKELVFKDICKHLKEEGYNGWVVLLEALHSGEFKQPAAEWSEEDEKNLELVIDCVYDFYPDPVMKYKLKDWLKSLRPSWKPSEEQVSMLLAVIRDPNNAGAESCHLALESLLEDLKKL